MLIIINHPLNIKNNEKDCNFMPLAISFDWFIKC